MSTSLDHPNLRSLLDSDDAPRSPALLCGLAGLTDTEVIRVVAAYEAADEPSTKELGQRFNRSEKWVRARLLKGGAKMRPQRRKRIHVVSPEQASTLYAEHGSVVAAAQAAQVPKLVMTRALNDAGVKRGTQGNVRQEWPVARVESTLHEYLSCRRGATASMFPSRAEMRDDKRFALLRGMDATGGASHWSQVVNLPIRRPGKLPR